MYAIEVVPEVERQIDALHPKRFKQVYLRILALQQSPRPPDSVLLNVETYLVRVGPYAITYEIDDSLQRIRVLLFEEQVQKT